MQTLLDHQADPGLSADLEDLAGDTMDDDVWIAAVALANDMDVVTQDGDFDAIEAAGGPAVVKV